MKTILLTQPFDSNNLSIRFGQLFIELLGSTDPLFNRIWIVSAFANERGVKRILPHLQAALLRGTKVEIVIGFDHQSTSIEALRALMTLGVSVQVVHNNQPGHTFHPKIYLLEATGGRAELFVGSHNLTEGGLFTNYEASTQMSFEFPLDDGLYAEFKQSLERFLNPPQAISQLLSFDLIQNLIERGEIISEQERREKTNQSSATTSGLGQTKPKSRFGNEPIPNVTINPKAKAKKSISNTDTAAILRGGLVWQKILNSSDAQRPKTVNTNVTGNLRLTQAADVNEQEIDQMRFFRYEVFGKLYWEEERPEPKLKEQSFADFNVDILGIHSDIYNLRITHQPSREANQNNHTTTLHWGELTQVLQHVIDIRGKILRLYMPPDNSHIFTIEII